MPTRPSSPSTIAALCRWGQRRRLLIRMLETSPFSGEWHKNFCGRRSAIGRSQLIVDRLFRPRTVSEPRLLSSRWLLSLRRMHLWRATAVWVTDETHYCICLYRNRRLSACFDSVFEICHGREELIVLSIVEFHYGVASSYGNSTIKYVH